LYLHRHAADKRSSSSLITKETPTGENMKNILRKLATRREAEKSFITFCEKLLKDEVVNHIAQEHQKKFVELLTVLRDDSRRHYELVRNIIHKYDKAKLFTDSNISII
jgi:hypothetical protein